MKLSALMVLLLIAFAVPAHAQDISPVSAFLDSEYAPRPPQSPNNAAWAYLKAWDSITSKADREAFGTAVGDVPARGSKLKPTQREQLAAHREYIDGTIAASGMPFCDFGPRYDQGFYALLPYLGPIRGSCRAVRMDAIRCAEDGNSPGAAERIVALLHMSTHAAHDRFLISGLVGIAIGSLAAESAQDMIAQHQVTPAAARIILPAVREITTSKDLYNMGQAIDGERDMAISWLRRQCTGDDAGLKFLQLMGDLQSLTFFDWPPLHFCLVMNEERMAREIDHADRFYDAVKAAWDKPNATVILDELSTELDEGQFGLVAQVVGAAFSRCRRSTNQVARTLARLDANLTAIIEANDPAAVVPYH